MTQQVKGEPSIVMGRVTHIFPPGEREGKNGKYLAPGKMLLESDKLGTCAISFFQLFNDLGERTENMPEIWNTIWSDQDSIKGNRVIISCKFDSDYLNPNSGVVQHNYNKASTIEYVDFEVGPLPTATPTAPAVASATGPASTTPQQVLTLDQRIAWNSAVNNAVSKLPFSDGLLHNNQETALYEGEWAQWIGDVDVLAHQFYALIRRGPVECDEWNVPVVEISGGFRGNNWNASPQRPQVEAAPEDEYVLFPEANGLGAGLSGEII